MREVLILYTEKEEGEKTNDDDGCMMKIGETCKRVKDKLY
jgi:hypothetical protein